jgi:RNA polymerase sigma factor (sigma-70 family)
MPADQVVDKLVERALGGDGSAFAELVRPEYPVAFRLARWMLRNDAEAEDAVQDAALKAWKKLRTFRRGSPFRPWFLKVVANQCRDFRRGGWMPTTDLEPVDRGTERDLAAILDLHRALRRLHYDDRLIVVLRYFLRMPFDEIAGTLGITEKAARLRLDRAIKKLRPMLRMQEVTT